METPLVEMKEMIARIDERTLAILRVQKEIKDNFEPRIRKLEGRQNWIVGVGSGFMAILGIFIAFFKTIWN